MERLSRIVNDPNEEMIAHYCEQARREIESSPDIESAMALKESLCQRFERECESTLVVKATREYIDRVIAGKWPTGSDK